jgi:phosphatidylserine/phosphatidylglycerophosphate/cardiolipin synthase-like enzyme
MRVLAIRPRVCILLLIAACVGAPPAAAQSTYNRLCDPAFENCRTPILDLIKNESVGIDVSFWFMEDPRYATELIKKHQAGVPVRVVLDSEAWGVYGYNAAKVPVDMMANAGIPMREKTGSAGIYHFKHFIFAGQNVVEFSGANFSEEAFVPRTPYSNYVDEVIVFSDEPSIVNSFKTKFDDVWTDTTTGTQKFSNYANITGPLTRHYPTYPMDPELLFVPWQNFATKSVARYRAETAGIDAIMYRITDQRHTNEMIAAVARGVPVRLIHEQQEYRNVGKLWNAWNVDRMYMAGVQVRNRGHEGLSHEKLTVLRGQHMAVMGSSNWTSASASGQHENDIFTTRPWLYDVAATHFDRKWNNTGPVQESQPFVPLPPDAPIIKSPADAAQNQPFAVTLKWWGGPWAHKYDVYFGTNPSSLTKIVNDEELGPSESNSDVQSHNVTGLAEGTTYYWRVVSRTMANLEKAGPVWSFRTSGAPPIAGGSDVVLWAWKAPSVAGWSVVTDPTAAGGKRLSNANLGAPKLSAPLENPDQFFELGFVADAGVPYRLWIRGKATSNSYNNDSVYAQFNDSVTSTGAAQWRLGTTSATVVTIEDCASAGLANWGWNDNSSTTCGGLGPLVYFANNGAHTLRVQVREDGLSIDQIVLSRDTFLNTMPGLAQNDATVYGEQNSAPLDGNAPPTVSLTTPAAGASFPVPGAIEFAATASDVDGLITKVDFIANGTVIGTDPTAPYSFTWNATAPGSYAVQVKAYDNRAATAVSPNRVITLTPAPVNPGEEIVLYASTATVGGGWNVTADATAAGGYRLQNPNAEAAKLDTALAAPTQYFELTFNALAGRPYHLWIRGKATSNSWKNDSVHVQFSGSVTSTGVATYRIATTSSAGVTIEDCNSCGLANWGWNDNALDGLGPPIYFAASGPQTIRVQVREDGLGIDQIVLSSVYYTNVAPGGTKNDTTILSATP